MNSLTIQKPSRPLLGIALLGSSLFLLLALLTHTPSDASWNVATSTVQVTNWGGRVGSFLSDFFLQSLGLTSYPIILFLFFIGIQSLKIKLMTVEEQKKTAWKQVLSLLLFVPSFSCLLSLIPYTIYNTISLGGLLGVVISEASLYSFNLAGTLIVSSCLLWISIVLFTGHLFLLLPAHFRNFSLPWKWHKKQLVMNTPIFSKPVLHSKLITPENIESSPSLKQKESVLSKLFSSDPSQRVLLVDNAPTKKQEFTPQNYEFPSLQLLDLPEQPNTEISKDELIAHSRALELKLLDFSIQGQVTNIHPGPIITLYEFEPAPGVKVKNILNLADDLKLAMKTPSVRILAPIPGRAAVGIEIPNPRRKTVYLREILQSPLFQNSPSPLTLGMGKTTAGDSFITDLSKMPHLLIAGATGSGKSVGINSMIVSMLYKSTPEALKFIMMDPKMIELSVYEGIPHLLLPVVTDPKKAARALQWAVKEMERRYKLISSLGVRNLKSFNEKVEKLSEEELKREVEMVAQAEATTRALIEDEEVQKEEQKLALQEAGLTSYVKLPYIVIVIDELADLIMVAAHDVEESIARLAQMARAAGIHLLVATQRPSVDVITGVIKANLPTRCAFQVASKVDSRTIIDCSGAENLLGDGDMLFLPPGTSRMERLHGPFISEDEIHRIVRHLKHQGSTDYASEIDLEDPNHFFEDSEDVIDDELYQQALTVVFETKSPSASMLQRRLRVGYNRAARLIERMEREGIVSEPLTGGRGRELLMTPPEN